VNGAKSGRPPRLPCARPGRRRPRAPGGRGVGALAAGFGAAALATGALALLAAPAGGAGDASSGQATHGSTVWLCRPGLPHDPCTVPFTTTSVSSTGSRTEENASPPSSSSTFDCFYVYPTVSTQPGENANLVVQRVERDAAIVEASPFSQMCDVWAPMYRQTTIGDIVRNGIGGIPHAAVLTAYESLLAGWKDFIAHDDDGRPLILIGHSQGAALLIRLIRQQIDPDAGLRARTVLAILAGGNLQVPAGRSVGATFKHVALCTKTGATGCAIAWSSFPAEPPKNSPFGRAGEGVSVQAGEPASRGQRVACTNPAALSGGDGTLEPYFVRAQVQRTQVPALSPAPSTTWVTFPGLYSAHCAQSGGVTWLQVDHKTGTGRPVVVETQAPGFGYHANDVSLVLGNLLEDVAAAEASYRAQS
jgi:hypothetical protein